LSYAHIGPGGGESSIIIQSQFVLKELEIDIRIATVAEAIGAQHDPGMTIGIGGDMPSRPYDVGFGVALLVVQVQIGWRIGPLATSKRIVGPLSYRGQ